MITRDYHRLNLPKSSAIAISPQKCGTHLIAELMHHLGFALTGTANLAERSNHPIQINAKFELACRISPQFKRFLLKALRPLSNRAALQIAESLKYVLIEHLGGASNMSRYGKRIVYPMAKPLSTKEFEAKPLSETLRGFCHIQHEMILSRASGDFIREWSETGEPKVIFLYRDPRAVLVSYISYLMKENRRGSFGRFAEYRVYNDILKSLPDDQSRIDHAISDPNFPGRKDFERASWMLFHPKVLSIRFEDLIGPAGGGSAEQQQEVIRQVCQHLNIEANISNMQEKIFNEEAFSFRSGQIDEWRHRMTPHQIGRYNRQYRHILKIYGYLED